VAILRDVRCDLGDRECPEVITEKIFGTTVVVKLKLNLTVDSLWQKKKDIKNSNFHFNSQL